MPHQQAIEVLHGHVLQVGTLFRLVQVFSVPSLHPCTPGQLGTRILGRGQAMRSSWGEFVRLQGCALTCEASLNDQVCDQQAEKCHSSSYSERKSCDARAHSQFTGGL